MTKDQYESFEKKPNKGNFDILIDTDVIGNVVIHDFPTRNAAIQQAQRIATSGYYIDDETQKDFVIVPPSQIKFIKVVPVK